MSPRPPRTHAWQVAVAACVIVCCASPPHLLAQAAQAAPSQLASPQAAPEGAGQLASPQAAPPAHPSAAPEGASQFTGRRLEDALRVLQTRGLRLVFSSEVVTPDMRVRTAPRAQAPKDQLAELLQPHGLMAEAGPGGVLLIVRRAKPPVPERPRSPGTRTSAQTDRGPLEPRPIDALYRERVTVFGVPDAGWRDEPGTSARRRLGSTALGAVSGQIADDPLRAVQALPGVATGDDFRSEYSVRGSRYRHAGVVIDGVIAPWLQHAALGRGDTGTLTMLRGEVMGDATLSVGAYPRRDGSQIGPQLQLTLREGSRTARRFQAGVSSTSTTLTAEGPLGSSARGSWLVGVRKSHGEWPVGRSDEDSTVFGFGDLQSKVVYDVHPDHHVALSIVAGQSDVEREQPNPFALADGRNRAAMATLAWRSVIGSRAVVTQRVSSIAHDFLNHTPIARGENGGADRAHAYRVDVSQPLLRGVIALGGQARWLRGSRHGPGPADRAANPEWVSDDSPHASLDWVAEPPFIDTTAASWVERSAHASYQRSIGTAVTIEAGLRASDSTLAERAMVDRWLQAEWAIGPRWALHASTGVMHQLPVLDQVAARPEGTALRGLRPERATYVDVGVGQRLSAAIRWEATFFARNERDLLRQPDSLTHARLIDGVPIAGDASGRFENALSGMARGIELTLARQSESGPSGWIGYAYGVARYTDAARHETFPADFDQRHAINLSGAAPLPWKARLGLTFRGGTNVPLPGYLVTRDGRLFAGPERNRERLPAYARLDLRTERTFMVAHGPRRATVFVDAINLLNRANVGPADGAIRRDTGEAVGFTERLFPRLLTAGLRFSF